MSLVVNLNYGDDQFFNHFTKTMNLAEFMTFRYNQWTSRVIIEIALYTVTRYHIVFRILNPLVFALLAYSLYRIIPGKKATYTTALIVLLILFIPVEIYFSAGILTTNVHYLWMVTLGAFSLIPLRKIHSQENIAWYEYFYFMPALIYATNNEQMAIAIMSFYGLVFLNAIWKKKIHPYLPVVLAITFLNMVAMLLSPGNFAREAAEVKNWNPAFPSYTLLDKVEVGFGATMHHFILNSSLLFLTLAILVAMGIFYKYKETGLRIMASIPVGVVLMLGFLGKFLLVLQALGEGAGLRTVFRVVKENTVAFRAFDPTDLSTIIPLLLVLLVLGTLLYSIHKLFEDPWKSWEIFMVLGVGLMTRLLMGFSPTIFASGVRTFYILYLCMIYVTAVIFQEVSTLHLNHRKK